MPKKIDLYTYRVTWSEEDDEFVGLCAEFQSLSWLDSSPEKAMKGIRKVVTDILKDMQKNHEIAPEPISQKKFSGKFMVRVPPQLHRKLAIEASEASVSLNRFISAKLG